MMPVLLLLRPPLADARWSHTSSVDATAWSSTPSKVNPNSTHRDACVGEENSYFEPHNNS